jgi:hypothetical protein
VLFACPSARLAAPPESDAEAVVPLHIVVSARGAVTEIHILRALPRPDAPLDPWTRGALARLQSAISETIGRIGMRVGVGV